MVGLPLVPELAWRRVVPAMGVVTMPSGYWSRRSCLTVKGSDARSSTEVMPAGSTSARRSVQKGLPLVERRATRAARRSPWSFRFWSTGSPVTSTGSKGAPGTHES